MGAETWAGWAIGATFGAVAGLTMAIFGAPALVLSLALLGLAFLAARSLALLSGTFMGVGGVWIALIVRAELACEAFDAAPNQGCTSFGVEPFLAVGAVVLVIGLLLGVGAVVRGRSTPSNSSLSR